MGKKIVITEPLKISVLVGNLKLLQDVNYLLNIVFKRKAADPSGRAF